jgi:ribose transport system substrate-binding protein
MDRRKFLQMGATAAAASTGVFKATRARAAEKEIVYITSALEIPCWRLVHEGCERTCKELGFKYSVLNSRNSAPVQLQNAQDAISRGVAGIVLSPTDSATAPSVIALAKRAGVPVAIADVGADSGDYISYVHSDNFKGGIGIGNALAAAFKKRGWTDAPYAIIAISQARKIGQQRTAGFRQAIRAAGFTSETSLQQMQSYTMDETLKFSQDALTATPNLHGLFIELDQVSLSGLQAIKAAGKQDNVMLVAFDGNLQKYMDLLKAGEFTALGLQRMSTMGSKSVENLKTVLDGGTVKEKETVLEMLIATPENIDELLPEIQKTILV